jgi:hypothetical protein
MRFVLKRKHPFALTGLWDSCCFLLLKPYPVDPITV